MKKKKEITGYTLEGWEKCVRFRDKRLDPDNPDDIEKLYMVDVYKLKDLKKVFPDAAPVKIKITIEEV